MFSLFIVVKKKSLTSLKFCLEGEGVNQKLGVALLVKIFECKLCGEKNCSNFFFLGFYGLECYLSEGKGVRRLGVATTCINLYKIFLLGYSSLFVFTRD